MQANGGRRRQIRFLHSHYARRENGVRLAERVTLKYAGRVATTMTNTTMIKARMIRIFFIIMRWRIDLRDSLQSGETRSRTKTQTATMTIHDTPNRSVAMPKRGEKKVLVNGICTCPPLANAANTRSASASLGMVIESENP